MHSAAGAEALDVAALLVVVAWALLRPSGWSEAVLAVPVALVLMAVGAVRTSHAIAQLGRLAPVVGFLAAVLLLAWLCEQEGLFSALADRLAGRARSPAGLLAAVFGLAAVTTALLSLDTTVVLLTPVVLASARTLRVSERPQVYACGHLANTASLLLPVSNLTNLLAYGATGLSFARFTALMAPPWLAAVAAEYLLFRWFFAGELAGPLPPRSSDPHRPVPWTAAAVLSATLAGFVLTGAFQVAPVWAALAGALVLSGRALLRARASLIQLLQAAAIPFALFVLALGIVVQGVEDNGLGTALGRVLPHGSGLLSLLAIAGLAAALANLVNNLPAVLVLLPIAVSRGTAAVLAVLIGVNLGPNLSYLGSLATLLWRRVLLERSCQVSVREFSRLGALTVPVTGVVAVGALWASVRLFGP